MQLRAVIILVIPQQHRLTLFKPFTFGVFITQPRLESPLCPKKGFDGKQMF